MKSVARMALEKDMIIANDVQNYHGDLIAAKGTVVDDALIAKLDRHSIICVDVMEDVDFATTHFEKIRLSKGFLEFEEAYHNKMPVFKQMMSDFVSYAVPPNVKVLQDMQAYLSSLAPNGATLLDYLYNMLADEDELTHAHCLNSALIARVFADWLNISREKKDLLIQCAFFYDIGKLKLSPDILWKPGKLTDLEYMQVKTHTITGYNLLENLEVDDCVKRCALMHHERCNGTGYPSKLSIDQIDIYARYMAIIDAYEAMTSPRYYRQSLTPFQVIANFEDAGVAVYDMELLRPILKRIADSQIGLTVKLSDDSIWEVLVINSACLSRPILKRGDELLDLSHSNLKIISIY